jgi:hypothetical protein
MASTWGLLLISMEAGDYDDVMGEWLGVPMFISCHGPDTMKRMVDEAGFELLEITIETQLKGAPRYPICGCLVRSGEDLVPCSVPHACVVDRTIEGPKGARAS